MHISRRQFNQYLLAFALSGLSRYVTASPLDKVQHGPLHNSDYGELIADPEGVLDLPEGFTYRVISALGDIMSDGLLVPDRADGMGCFYLDDDRIVLVRNHELAPQKAPSVKLHKSITSLAYDHDSTQAALPGGTSSIVYNLKTKRVENQFMSLIGTVRNCAGGITPWNTWLTCEESMLKASEHNQQDHGYVFEVPATATSMVKAVPLKAMGRFNHEAACVDPHSGIVYMTEDRGDSLFYRFIPNTPGKLERGGKLQALAIQEQPKFDSRNWSSPRMKVGEPLDVTWIDLTNVDSPDDDLRMRGHSQGAALFARGEGVHWGDNELYFCCTNGGANKLGQIMRYIPSEFEGQPQEMNSPGKLELFVESPDKQTFNFGDNITVAPNGHLIVCEDQYTDKVDNCLKGIKPDGSIYNLARIRWQTESAGVCFSPDGSTLFVNLYSPARTLAITGPWTA